MPDSTPPKPPGTVTTTLTTHANNAIVATLTITNPDRLNSLNTSVCNAIITSIQSLSTNPHLRCVILTGGECTRGSAFAGGADIHEMSTLPSASSARNFITHLHLACQSLRKLHVPTISRINGHALGGGMILSISADFKLVLSSARLGMPEVQRGVPSTMEAALLPGLIGEGRARRLLLLGDTIDAQRAEQWGLVDWVLPDERALDAKVSECVDVLLRNGKKAMAAQKRLFRVWEQVSVREGVRAGVWEFGRAFEDEDEDGEGGMAEGRRMTGEFLKGNKARKGGEGKSKL